MIVAVVIAWMLASEAVEAQGTGGGFKGLLGSAGKGHRKSVPFLRRSAAATLSATVTTPWYLVSKFAFIEHLLFVNLIYLVVV